MDQKKTEKKSLQETVNKHTVIHGDLHKYKNCISQFVTLQHQALVKKIFFYYFYI